MKDYTIYLKKESDKDFTAIRQHNNNKIGKRTPEQNEQAYNDKVNFYLNKWNKLLAKAETPAQTNICNNMLRCITNAPKYY